MQTPGSVPARFTKGLTMRTVNIGLIGLGVVGGGVARLINKHHDDYVRDYGIDLRIKRGCARFLEEAQKCGVPEEAFTNDWHDVVNDPDIDIVVELIGGDHPALDIFEIGRASCRERV